MSRSWVAGVVRAKALARRRLGPAGARALAAQPGPEAAVTALAATPYGHDVHPGQDLGTAQHAVGAALLWDLRVLAGWLPRGGADVVRLLAGGFEVANVDEHLARLRGAPARPPYRLGTLDTAWARLAATTSAAAVAEVLATSSWRLRGARTPREVALGLRLAWADAVITGVPEAAGWARAGAALVVLREVVAEHRRLAPGTARLATAILGPGLERVLDHGAADLPALRRGLPQDVRWLLDDVESVADLWRAEVAWVHRVEREGFALLRGSGYDRRPVVGAIAVLAGDAWRVRAALEAAGRGGTGASLEAFDAVA
ncbi:hypothetical protein [Georgenia thermotolerans]|uniref:V-type ATPase subunit n=1 Tax=Georgenia thermotolerans TaxID=527326 RepID=A0A7J5UJV8_9MICO|nr:hypothetical protein [Georgenia thermotolerans]KAE8762173.1 hypothetical protein GB883_20750 [Georgenia thermotolerans]